MHPLPSSSINSDIVFSRTWGGPGPITSQSSKERAHTSQSPHSRSRTTHDRGRQATESLKPKRLSPDLFVPTPGELEKRSRPLRNRPVAKHRASVDVTSTMGWVKSAGGVRPVTEFHTQPMRSHKVGQASVDNGVLDRRDVVEPLPYPSPEKQRAMNVRRAKKIQQVLGSEPPPPLFQITHIPPAPEFESEITDAFDDRASVSTLFSAFTTNFQSSEPITGRRRSVSNSSTLIGPTPPSRPITPVLPPLELHGPQLPRFGQSFQYDQPMESPPLSHMVYTHKAVPSRGETSKASTRTERRVRGKEKEFRRRRMRAAKLSSFFGVDYHDLEPHLALEEHRAAVGGVEVVIDDRGVMPWDRHEQRSLEMEDVIVRLRDLRSS